MRRLTCLIPACLALAGAALGQTPAVPVLVSTANSTTAPYSYSGILTTGDARGSASLVAEGAFATAAHVVYDDVAKLWIPASQARFYPRYNEGKDPALSTAPSFVPAGIQGWTSYYPYREGLDDEPGFSSIDTFNVDVAIGWFSAGVTSPLVTSHPEVHVDPVGATGILRDSREKRLIGYPAESPYIPLANQGRMHEIVPGNYYSQWEGIEGLSETDPDYPGEPLWYGMYSIFDITGYAGSSGGPVHIKDDLGNWLTAGILVGSSGSDQVLIRAFDDNAYAWVEEAVALRGTDTLRRVEDVSVTATARASVTLGWTDSSAGEAGYRIFRQENGTWTTLPALGPDATSFTDYNVLSGHVYQYTVQPFAANGNRPPKSAATPARTRGNNTLAGGFLFQPRLQFSNAGDSNWHVDPLARLRAGKVRANGHSSLRLDIIGPGIINFQWSVSSEANPDYQNPGDEIFDALYLYLDGTPVTGAEEVVFISGQSGPAAVQLTVPPGGHQVEWRYAKDPYAEEGEDTGFLHSLQWTPDAAAPYPVWGAYAFAGTSFHGSEWFGVWDTTYWPWSAHVELGWMYFAGTADGRLYGYSVFPQLGKFYTTPSIFPWLYLTDTATWLYYYPGTGSYGRKAWFWNANTNSYFQIP